MGINGPTLQIMRLRLREIPPKSHTAAAELVQTRSAQLPRPAFFPTPKPTFEHKTKAPFTLISPCARFPGKSRAPRKGRELPKIEQSHAEENWIDTLTFRHQRALWVQEASTMQPLPSFLP